MDTKLQTVIAFVTKKITSLYDTLCSTNIINGKLASVMSTMLPFATTIAIGVSVASTMIDILNSCPVMFSLVACFVFESKALQE